MNLSQSPVIAITGTRGKTTTATWIYYFLKSARLKTILGGNQPNKALFYILPKIKKNVLPVIETSSFQLEFADKTTPAPHIAIITNLYADHLNRYKDIKTYAKTKSNIFLNQSKNDFLILNKDNKWTKFFLSFKPKSQVFFVSKKPLKKNEKGVYLFKNHLCVKSLIYSHSNKKHITVKKIIFINDFVEKYGEHNLYNLMVSALGAIFSNVPIEIIQKSIDALPFPKFRQEIIYGNKNFKIINDSAGTSPDATIQALRRFAPQGKLVLITGGTDKNLDFKNLAKEIKLRLTPEQVIFLNGSATQKLLNELKKIGFKYIKEAIFENLKDCVQRVFANIHGYHSNIHKSIQISGDTLLFSPGAASFEKFRNEFDRGKKFNIAIKK